MSVELVTDPFALEFGRMLYHSLKADQVELKPWLGVNNSVIRLIHREDKLTNTWEVPLHQWTRGHRRAAYSIYLDLVDLGFGHLALEIIQQVEREG